VDKIVSCEISFIPVQSRDYKNDVNQVLSIINAAGMNYDVSLFSTTITGERDRIFELIKNIFTQMEDKTNFTMVVKYSNICGCPSV